MSRRSFTMPVMLIAAMFGVAACQTVTAEPDSPARITEPSDASRTALQNAVNTALHTEVVIADDALTTTSLLVIERNPSAGIGHQPTQGRIMETPVQFRLVTNGSDCILVDQRNGDRYPLVDTRCTAE